jgi:hypothetical protein
MGVSVFTRPPTCDDTLRTHGWLTSARAPRDSPDVMSSSLRDAPPTRPRSGGPKASLSLSKVVAGAGAAATTAVVGSSFGADGTVVGAAVGSVVSAVAAATYERSLDRTRQVVVSRVRLPTARSAEATQVIPADDVTEVIPAQRPAEGARFTAPTVPAPRSRRTRLPLLAAATALIFLAGLLGVTGVELLTGGPVLSSQKGTSVGRVFGYTPAASPTTSTDAPTTPTPTATRSAAPSSDSPTSATPTSRATRSERDASVAPSTTAARARASTTAPASAGASPNLGE